MDAVYLLNNHVLNFGSHAKVNIIFITQSPDLSIRMCTDIFVFRCIKTVTVVCLHIAKFNRQFYQYYLVLLLFIRTYAFAAKYYNFDFKVFQQKTKA